MNKTLARVLAAILVLCMLPATFLTALAGGYGDAKNETENQSIDNANGQYIPETIVVDGEFNDTGWAIEGWNYVTASTGNWNVEDPSATAQQMMYQYQLRADYKYFYAGAAVVLPDSVSNAKLKIYLSDDSSSYKTASLFTFSLEKSDGTATVVATDCDTSDSVSVQLYGDLFVPKYLGDGKFYIEFRNAAQTSYDIEEQVKYYVSLDVTVDGADQSLYHPVYETSDGVHAVPTSEFWPGGGDLLTVSYTDVNVYSANPYSSTDETYAMNDTLNDGNRVKDTDGYKGAIELDGLFNEEMWRGLTDYYTTENNNLVDFVNEDKGIIDGVPTNLVNTDMVHYLPNNLLEGNSYSSSVDAGYQGNYLDDGNELTNGVVVTEDDYTGYSEAGYKHPELAGWVNSAYPVFVFDVGNGDGLYPVSIVRLHTLTKHCGAGLADRAFNVEYSDDNGTTWKTFGTIAKNTDESTYTKVIEAKLDTPVWADKIRITPTTSGMFFLSEIEAFSSDNHALAPDIDTNVAKYDFRYDDEYIYGAIIACPGASNLLVGGKKITCAYVHKDGEYLFRYEFKVKLSDYPEFAQDTTDVKLTVGTVTYENLIARKVPNGMADYVKADGIFDEQIWTAINGGDDKFAYLASTHYTEHDKYYNDNVKSMVYEVKADYEYIYGAAILELSDNEFRNEYTQFRLMVSPGGDSVGNDDRCYVDMYISNANNANGKQFARVSKILNGNASEANTAWTSYRWSEFSVINIDESGMIVTLEFKVPYKLFGWEGPKEQAVVDANYTNSATHFNNDPNFTRENPFDFESITANDENATLFSYYFCVAERNDANGDGTINNSDAASNIFFSKEQKLECVKIVYGSNNTNNAYDKHGTAITYGDLIDTVTIDGHIDEAVWADKDFYHADFADSTVVTRPTKGEVFDYSYMLYGGSNYIYGAVELNDIAREGTTFTLWLNNFVDEYAWIGDEDDTTPHIIYDIKPITTTTTVYDLGKLEYNKATYSIKNAIITNDGSTTSQRLNYYTNYKYEFDLSAVTAKATPDFYFATDSNLEKDKTKIVENVNYKYAVTSINGKTYLEFMIDVDNFHWDNNSFEYVTSVTHTVSGAAGKETLTVYHPQINDRANFWLTNTNCDAAYRHDGASTMWTDAAKYNNNLPPSAYWVSLKLEPTDTAEQYKIIEMTNGYWKYELQSDGKVKSTYRSDETVAKWHDYSEEESNAGIIFYISFKGTLYPVGGQVLKYDNSQLGYPWVRYMEYDSATYSGDTYYYNKYVLDGVSARTQASDNTFWNWVVGDVVEFGKQNTEVIEDKASDGKKVIPVSGTSLSSDTDHPDLINSTDKATMLDFYGYQWNTLGAEKRMPLSGTFGDKVAINSYTYEPGVMDSTSGAFADSTGKELTNGNKLTLNKNEYVVLYSKSKTDSTEDDYSAYIDANIKTGTKSNTYTAYLYSGHGGVISEFINMEIYGAYSTGADTGWHRITSASYRQQILRKGDGVYGNDTKSDGVSAASYANGTTVFNPAEASVKYHDPDHMTAAIATSRLGDGIANVTDYTLTNSTNYFAYNTTYSGAGVMLDNPTYASGTNNFFLDTTFDTKSAVNSYTIGLYTHYTAGYGFPDASINIYTSTDGEKYTYVETLRFGEKFDAATAAEYGSKGRMSKYTFALSQTYETKYIRAQIFFPKVEEGANPHPTKNDSGDVWKYWRNMCITESSFSYSEDSMYTLTAIVSKPVTYDKIRFKFYDASPSTANNFIGLDEIEIAYSAEIEQIPTKTILHVNTDQSTPTKTNIENGTYKGRYNTTGSTWTNSGTSMTKPNSNSLYSNNVFVETIPLNGYEDHTLSSPGMYSDYYIERVQSAGVNQTKRPDDEGNNKWDKSTNGILKKLEHIAPDVIDVDGNLNDTGWDGTWTEVDGLKNATNFNGTGTDFKYQLRADGEYLYVAAIIDAAYDTAEPELKLWIKGDESATSFTNLYTVGVGDTALAIGAQATDSTGVVDAPYLVYQYGEDNIDGSISVAAKIGAYKNNSATPNGMNDKTDLDEYLSSAIYGYTKEVVESTHDGVWSWEAKPITQGHRVALEHACINSASGKTAGNTVGDASKTIVEFRVALDEFDGADGFEYFIEACTTSGSTVYPHIYTEKGYDEYHHPSWAWDSDSAVKVTAEDMTGWGSYRMVNDYAPMTSLGAKINPSYGENNDQKAIRFGARYTEEFIRRTSDPTADYWDVESAGIVFAPTHVVENYDPYNLTVDTSSAKVVEALDIINWMNDTPDGSTNFADYTSFVFFVNLVGIPDGYEAMEFSFRGYVDYFGTGDPGRDTYYGIPLERSYSLVGRTANEGVITDARNAEVFDCTLTVENGAGVVYYDKFDAESAARVLNDGHVYIRSGNTKASDHNDPANSPAYLFENSDPKTNTGCNFTINMAYEQDVAFNTVDLGLYMAPCWKIAPPKSVTVYVDGVEKETVDNIYSYTADVMDSFETEMEAKSIAVGLSEKYVGQNIKLVFTFLDFEYHSSMVGEEAELRQYKEHQFVGLTEVGLSVK